MLVYILFMLNPILLPNSSSAKGEVRIWCEVVGFRSQSHRNPTTLEARGKGSSRRLDQLQWWQVVQFVWEGIGVCVGDACQR